MGMLRTDTGVIESGRNGPRLGRVVILIHQAIGVGSLEHTLFSQAEGCCGFGHITFSPAFGSINAYPGIIQESLEESDRIGSASYAGINAIGKFSFLLQDLFAGFPAYDALKIAHHVGIGMRSYLGAQAVEGFGMFYEVAQGSIHRIGQGLGTLGSRNYLCTEKFHTAYIGSLAFDIDGTHEDLTLDTEKSCGGCGGNTVLTSSRFGNHLFGSHAFGQKELSDRIVDLMGPGMIQIFPFEVDLAAHLPGESFGVKQRGGSAYIFLQVVDEIPFKIGIILVFKKVLCQSVQIGFQNRGYESPSKLTVESGFYCLPCLLCSGVHGYGYFK